MWACGASTNVCENGLYPAPIKYRHASEVSVIELYRYDFLYDSIAASAERVKVKFDWRFRVLTKHLLTASEGSSVLFDRG